MRGKVFCSFVSKAFLKSNMDETCLSDSCTSFQTGYTQRDIPVATIHAIAIAMHTMSMCVCVSLCECLCVCV